MSMSTSVQATEAARKAIARRVAKGNRVDESSALLVELTDTLTGDCLAAALVYQDFATARTANACATALLPAAAQVSAPVEPAAPAPPATVDAPADSLEPGDRIVTHDVVVTILRDREGDPTDRFQRAGMFRYWGRREDTGAEGWIPFGQGGRVDLVAGATAVPVESSAPWGTPYGSSPAYGTPAGPVWMRRKGQLVRFVDAAGAQVGPEQTNVAPAVAYALSAGWTPAGSAAPVAAVRPHPILTHAGGGIYHVSCRTCAAVATGPGVDGCRAAYVEHMAREHGVIYGEGGAAQVSAPLA